MEIKKQDKKKWVSQQARYGRKQAVGVFVFSLLGVGIGIAQAWFLAEILGYALTGRLGLTQGFANPILLWILASLCRTLLIYLTEVQSAHAGRVARKQLRNNIISFVLKIGPSVLKKHHSAALASVVIDQIEVLEGYFARWLPASVLWFAAPCIILCVVVFIQPWVALVLGLAGLAIPIAQAVFGIGAALASRKQFLAMTRLQTRFLDRIRGIATLVFFNQVQSETERLFQAAESLRQKTMRILRIAFLSSAAIDCVMIVSIIIIAFSDSMLFRAAFNSGYVNPVWVIHALFGLLLVPEFFSPFRSLALAYQDRAHMSAAADEILPLQLRAQSTSASAHGHSSMQKEEPCIQPKLDFLLAELHGVEIVFENVSFAWDHDQGNIIDHFNCVVKPHSTLVISGASGAGKSTLMEMLLGFIVPQAGQITFNGIDISKISSKMLSELMAWIGQKPVLFSGTVRENILFARPDASSDELEQAIEDAGVTTFIADLPHGLDTLIGEGGYGLSGGQAQRVAIARAFLKNAPILLLDEPTTSLDVETERDILLNLERLRQGRTVIIASHAGAVHALDAQHITLDGSLTAKANLQPEMQLT